MDVERREGGWLVPTPPFLFLSCRTSWCWFSAFFIWYQSNQSDQKACSLYCSKSLYSRFCLLVEWGPDAIETMYWNIPIRCSKAVLLRHQTHYTVLDGAQSETWISSRQNRIEWKKACLFDSIVCSTSTNALVVGQYGNTWMDKSGEKHSASPIFYSLKWSMYKFIVSRFMHECKCIRIN